MCDLISSPRLSVCAAAKSLLLSSVGNSSVCMCNCDIDDFEIFDLISFLSSTSSMRVRCLSRGHVVTGSLLHSSTSLVQIPASLVPFIHSLVLLQWFHCPWSQLFGAFYFLDSTTPFSSSIVFPGLPSSTLSSEPLTSIICEFLCVWYRVL